MLAKVATCAVVGLEGVLVAVEVDIAPGLPAFNIVGLPDTAVQEARERVRAALRNSGSVSPNRRITVNLAPAHLKKEGPAYDLPIALGILLASEQLEADLSRGVFLGELSLDGGLRHTPGILAMVATALEQGIEVQAADSLTVLVAHLRGEATLPPVEPVPGEEREEGGVDLAHIKGQEHAKRALEVAAAA